jgi:hypothetical protein
MYLLGRRAPKCALVLTGAMKFFPELLRKHEDVKNAQKAVGRLPDEKPIESLRGTLRVFSALIGLSFEDAREQATLIVASGFSENSERRSADERRLRATDIFMLCATLFLTLLCAFLSVLGKNETVFYPTVEISRSLLSVIGRCVATLLFLLPFLINCFFRVSKCLLLKSKI